MDHTTHLAVRGMSCQSCARHVESALTRVPGVRSAVVNLARGEAAVRHDGTPANAALIAAVEKAGYDAEAAA